MMPCSRAQAAANRAMPPVAVGEGAGAAWRISLAPPEGLIAETPIAGGPDSQGVGRL